MNPDEHMISSFDIVHAIKANTIDMSPILSGNSFDSHDYDKRRYPCIHDLASPILSPHSTSNPTSVTNTTLCAPLNEIKQLQFQDCETYFPPIHMAKVVKVLDGDSLIVATKFVFSSQVFKFPIRLRGCEAPSIRSKKPSTKKAGQYVKRRLRDKVLGAIVRIDNMIKEKHGRFIADVFLHKADNANIMASNPDTEIDSFHLDDTCDKTPDNICINNWLRESNLCVEYNGGKKEKTNWFDVIGGENFM